MNATKRKFNALIQGLGNPPAYPAQGMNSPPAKTMDYEALLQKRRRLGFPESTAPKMDAFPARIIASPSSVSSRLSVGKPADGGDDSSLARYSPNGREDLLRRLATFQEITEWTPKPDEISEVEWARRGWVCKGKERVRCLLCHKELVVKLKKDAAEGAETMDESAAEEFEKAMVSKYQELIVTSHRSDCLWRRQGCDASLLRISFSSTKTVLEDLQQRYRDLCTRRAFLPYEFNIRLPEDVCLDEVIEQLPAGFLTDEKDPASPPNKPALALALLGWSGLIHPRIGAVPNSASCHSCLRRLGLWMFKSKEVDEHGNVIVPAPMDHLDPAREHRFFCPWKNATAQSRRSDFRGDSHHYISSNTAATTATTSDEPAWQLLLQSIKNDSDLRSVYEGRTKTPSRLARRLQASTPLSTPTQSKGARSLVSVTPGSADHAMSDPVEPGPKEEEKDEEAARNAKDKERWARLRKVKSLFDTKKLRKPMTLRPGTSQSVKSLQSAKQ